jgi:hypothetical protein
VQLILKSAVELQMRDDEAHASPGGMSLEQLEQVAREAGLDAAVIRQAAMQLDLRRDAGDPSLFGADHVLVERTVDFPIETSQFDHLLEIVRTTSGQVGEVGTVGRQFGWKGSIDGATTDVTVSVSDTSTTYRVRIDLAEELVGNLMLKGVLGGGMGGLLGGLGAATAAGMALPGVVAGIAIAVGGFLWARRGLRNSGMSYRARAEQLVEELVSTRPRTPDPG